MAEEEGKDMEQDFSPDALSALEEAETGAPPLEQTATVTVQQEIEAPFAPIRAATPVRQLQFASGNYRPTSVEIAAQIEGFDDDFKQAGGFLPEVAEGRDEAAADGGHFYDDDEEPESNLEDLIAQAEAQKAVLAIENVGLHQRVRQVLDARNKGRPAPYRDSAKLHGLDARYQSLLSTWGKLLEEQERLSSHFQAATLDLRAQLAERIGRSDDLRNTFHHFLMEVAKSAENSKSGRPIPPKVAKSAENSKSGRPIPPKVLADLAAADAGREGEVQKVRLKNIHLRNQLHKLEASVKQKEELAEGLHLIDFEQLKIENQSLNEKIEERCEELLKLRKKTTQTVQVLTHVKEKLQFVQKENTVLQGQLAEVEGAMADERDELSRVKGQRDRHKQRWHRLKETSSHINAPQLLEDIQGQRYRVLKKCIAPYIFNGRQRIQGCYQTTVSNQHQHPGAWAALHRWLLLRRVPRHA
ncbi:hypothetical protein WJX72_004456 [[Myrmecia] bisecta]|uniref:CCDC113/CCDC96 coiled-coil domain-containing protein n=1 Tax=[Myrmecia] bisecta TaxID=41462 RepID=A0AAW1NY18_9CHLO